MEVANLKISVLLVGRRLGGGLWGEQLGFLDPGAGCLAQHRSDQMGKSA